MKTFAVSGYSDDGVIVSYDKQMEFDTAELRFIMTMPNQDKIPGKFYYVRGGWEVELQVHPETAIGIVGPDDEETIKLFDETWSGSKALLKELTDALTEGVNATEAMEMARELQQLLTFNKNSPSLLEDVIKLADRYGYGPEEEDGSG